jgi:hypothetical protein
VNYSAIYAYGLALLLVSVVSPLHAGEDGDIDLCSLRYGMGLYSPDIRLEISPKCELIGMETIDITNQELSIFLKGIERDLRMPSTEPALYLYSMEIRNDSAHVVVLDLDVRNNELLSPYMHIAGHDLEVSACSVLTIAFYSPFGPEVRDTTVNAKYQIEGEEEVPAGGSMSAVTTGGLRYFALERSVGHVSADEAHAEACKK